MPTDSHYMRHFPFPTASNPASHCTQLSQWKNVKRRNPEFNSSEIFATLMNMFQALPRDELLHWEEKAALIRANPSVSPHNICAVASKKSTAKKGSCVCDRVCESVYLHYDTPLYFIRTKFHATSGVLCAIFRQSLYHYHLSYHSFCHNPYKQMYHRSLIYHSTSHHRRCQNSY